MHIKRLIPAVLTATALAISGCSAAPDDVSDHINTSRLNSHQKSVISVWYDVVDAQEKKRLEALSGHEVLSSVNAFTLLCAVDEDRIAAELVKYFHGVSKNGAARLADAIDDHLCEKPKTKTTKKPSASATASTPTTPKTPAAPSVDTNPTHDLTKPTSRHDREEMTLRAPANREPAKTHQHPAPEHRPQAPKPAPAAKAPAKSMAKSGR
ncbi:hypothetical protein [Streptomyces violaceusniger]|uniref:Lipoprotein n=1 Tax=Streptomyces violaceusniger (strain Tu 4113) TaxID=653045 RepID=G2PHI7_STRV4|nr:hypothetical protein [Streptomyces violaceusniger]AEM88990.1 hypothetical protein Strvi_0217 [Streptomyces violaceusniger Tu 4113]